MIIDLLIISEIWSHFTMTAGKYIIMKNIDMLKLLTGHLLVVFADFGKWFIFQNLNEAKEKMT